MRAIPVRVLGPVGIAQGDDQQVGLPGGRHLRTVLAALALRTDRSTSADRLVDLIWGDEPPRSAPGQVRNLVSALRDAVPAGVELARDSAGYRLVVPAGGTDVGVFRRLRQDAGRQLLQQQLAAGIRTLRDALDLWRGPALADAGARLREVEAPPLHEERIAALEALVEAELRAGRHRELLPELTELVAAEPLRESFRAARMIALHRADRRDDALAEYRSAREELVDTLGIEPGPGMRRALQQVLDGASGADEPPGPEPSAESGTGRCTLPADIPDFVGRRHLVAGVVSQAARPGPVVLSGPPGMGKTTAAVHLGHLLQGRFGGGQVIENLRGSGDRPRSGTEALRRLLLSLGEQIGDGAAGLDEEMLAARYRARLAATPVLVVLDDARDEAQVRPLLAGAGASLVLITSRRRLVGLDGALHLDVDGFSPAESRELLGRILGEGRARAEEAAAERIAELTAGMPLAVRLAAARLSGRADRRLGRLADALSDERRRLDELEVGDRGVRSSLSVVYRRLDPPTQRAFRMMHLLEDAELEAWMVAALLDVGQDEADAAVDALVEARLLAPVAVERLPMSRYALHDLIRVLSAELSRQVDSAGDRAAGQLRLSLTWLGVAAHAGEVAGMSSVEPRDPVLPGPGPDPRILEGVASAPLLWMSTMHAGLVRRIHRAAAAGEVDATASLTALFSSLLPGLHLQERWGLTHRAGVRAAGASPRCPAALLDLARTPLLGRERFTEMLDVLHAVQPLLASVPDPGQRARLATEWAEALRLCGDPAAALAEADAVARSLNGEPRAAVRAHLIAGHALSALGRPGEAADRYLLVSEADGSDPEPLIHLGDAGAAAGRRREAAHTYERAAAVAAARGDHLTSGWAYHRRARLALDEPDLRRVTTWLDLAGEVADRHLGTCVDYARAELRLRTGDRAAALEHAAGALARWTGAVPLWLARSGVTFGLVVLACERADLADAAWSDAGDTLRRLGSAEADLVALMVLELSRTDSPGPVRSRHV